MANKRIKISELPKITYSRLAGSTSVTEQDYIPIAVTDPDNLAVKTTQTITTKQLQRFVLQQGSETDEDSEWDPNTLYLGSKYGSTASEPFNVSVPGNLNIDGELTVKTIKPQEIVGLGGMEVQTLSASSTIEGAYVYARRYFVAGGSSGTTYPAQVDTPWTMLCSNAGGGSLRETPIKTLLASAPVTQFTDRVVTIDGQSRFNFNQTYEAFFEKTGLFNAADANKLLYVGSGYGFGKLDITSSQLESTIGTVSAIFGTEQSDPVDNTNDGTVFKCTNDVDSLSSAPVVVDVDTTKRAVFNSPVVFGAKHPDGEDLTEREVSYRYAAQLGELRWNFFNEIPTLYMAVKKDPDQGKTSVTIKRKDGITTRVVSGIDDNAMIWYGVPLFGTLHSLSGSLSGEFEDIDEK